MPEESLFHGRDALLVLDLGLDVANGVTWQDIDGEGPGRLDHHLDVDGEGALEGKRVVPDDTDQESDQNPPKVARERRKHRKVGRTSEFEVENCLPDFFSQNTS